MDTRLGITLCLTVLALATTIGRCQMTEKDKNDTLAFINYLRRNTVPQAADMNGLLWDTHLAGLAQKAADSCVFAHNYGGEYASLGEVLYLGGRQNFSEILVFMFLEREIYDHNTGGCTAGAGKYPFFSTCGHYLQMVSAGVNKVGCGIQKCGGNFLAACEFDREWSSPPFQVGEPGTKCGHGYATYLKDELCYSILVGREPPVPGPFDCKLNCLNYGTLVKSPFCMCTCPAGYFGVRCETKNPYFLSTIPNDCKAQGVQCKNGGTPTMSGTNCKCVCSEKFSGDNCEIDQTLESNSLKIYFGGEMRYQSYYPISPSTWNSTMLKQSTRSHLADAINKYCAANFATCCPSSTAATLPSTIEHFVTCEDFHVVDNYPIGMLDGTLRVDVYYTMQSNVATACTGSSKGTVSRSVLTAAWPSAAEKINPSIANIGLKAIRAE